MRGVSRSPEHELEIERLPLMNQFLDTRGKHETLIAVIQRDLERLTNKCDDLALAFPQ